MTEPASFGRTFDEPRNVREHELVILEPHDTEVGNQRGERIVRDLGLRRAHGRDQRGLPGVGKSDERGVGHEAEFELDPALLAVLTLFREARRPPRVGEKPSVPAATAPAVRGQPPVAVTHEIGDDLARTVLADRGPLGDVHREIGAGLAVALVPGTVSPRRTAAVRMVAEREERRNVAVGLEPDVAAGAAIATVGSALGRVRLTPERDAAGAAVATAHIQLRFVDKVRHAGAPVGCGRETRARGGSD